MANLKSSQKDIRRTRKKTAHNRSVKSRLRTLHQRVIAARQATEPDLKSLREAVRGYISAIDRAAKRRIIHPNAANRKKSELSGFLAP